MSLHVEGPFVKNFTIFIFGFFPEMKMIVGDAGKRISVVYLKTTHKMPSIVNFSLGWDRFFNHLIMYTIISNRK